MIEFINVSKSFKEDFWKEKKTVLNQLSFCVAQGSLCGFLGANGAGKTTSIKAMLGFIALDSGEIRFSKEIGRSFHEIKSNIGYFPEHPYFYSYMTGEEFCRYLGRLQGVSKSILSKNITKWAQKLNIDHALDKKIRNYSKGMLQRLGFVTALLHGPQLIILDEPLSGLDPLGRKDFKDTMLELNNQGITIFFSSHIVSDVEEICDSIVVIKKGETYYEGKTGELLSKSSDNSYEVGFKTQLEVSSLTKTFKSLVVNNSRDNFYRGMISTYEKDSFLKYAIENEIIIENIIRDRPTLEKIIYSGEKLK